MPSVLNCDGNAEIFAIFYDVSFAKSYDVNSAPNSQVVLLGSCIVDFCCPSAKLVVEVDGAYHAEPARKRACVRADARRARRLGKAGYRVVRVPAELVLVDGD